MAREWTYIALCGVPFMASEQPPEMEDKGKLDMQVVFILKHWVHR
jgi:hypothetical protein